AGFLVADLNALAVLAMTRRASLAVDRFAARSIELVDRNKMIRGNRVPAAPRRVLADGVALRQPREIRRHREHFFRGGRRLELTLASRLRDVVGRATAESLALHHQ